MVMNKEGLYHGCQMLQQNLLFQFHVQYIDLNLSERQHDHFKLIAHLLFCSRFLFFKRTARRQAGKQRKDQ